MRSLINCPEIITDESIRGYMIRLAGANHTTPRILYKLFSLNSGVDPRSLLMIVGKVPLKRAQELTSITEEELTKLSFYSSTGKYAHLETEDKILRHLSSFAFCSTYFSQICPCCLTEIPYHRKIWEIKLVTTCHKHRCRLESICPSCEKVLSPFRKHVTHCNCGFDLRKYTPKKVLAQETLLSSYITERYFENKQASIIPLPELSNLNFRHFLYLHTLFCYYFYQCKSLTNKVNYTSVYKPNNLFQVSENTFRMFIGWPDSFYDFIEMYRKIDKAHQSRVIKEFGMLHYRLPTHLSLNEYKFVTDVFSQYCEEKKDKEPILNKVNKKIIKSLDKGTEQTDYSQNKDEFVCIKDTVEMLGVSEAVIEELVQLGELKVFQGKKGHRYFTKATLNSVIIKIQSNTNSIKSETSQQESNVTTTFEHIPKLLHRRISMAKFISAAIHGKISVFHADLEKSGLNQFCFLDQEVEKFLRNDSVTVEEASKMLNVKRDSIVGWIRKGFLKKDGSRYYPIKVEDVNEFRNQFIPLTELVKLHSNINLSLFLHRWLDERRIHPISGPLKDGGKAYLYKRNEQLLHAMGLTSWESY